MQFNSISVQNELQSGNTKGDWIISTEVNPPSLTPLQFGERGPEILKNSFSSIKNYLLSNTVALL